MSTKDSDTIPGMDRQQDIIEELLALRNVVCDRLPTGECDPGETDEALAVFRLCPGLNMEDWRVIREAVNPDVWLTLPMDSNAYPHIKVLQDTLSKLSYETEHDALTGLANRRAFRRFLDLELERAKRNRTPVSLAILDLDDFKVVNDTYGHPKGDEVLSRFAEVLHQAKRRYDLAARIGGEEFALILGGVGSLKSQKILGRVMKSLSEIEFSTGDGETFSVTCSIGLAAFRGRGDMTVDELVNLADKALYDAKNQGKNRIVDSSLPDVEPIIKETLVHANEKKFLFTGM